MDHSLAARVTTALVTAGAALPELDARARETDRSPRLAAVADRLAVIRSLVESGAGPSEVVAEIELAAAMVDELQAECNAPEQVALYADIRRELGTMRRVLTGIDR